MALSKDQTQIDIANPRLSYDPADDNPPKIPFSLFRPLKQRRENTWVISLLVVLHVVAFAATMFVNNCWQSSHGDCAISSLGRVSFQPLAENPLLGPSSSTLDTMGGLRQNLVMKEHQIWRLFTSPVLHAGLFHLVINLSSIVFIGIHLEQEFGPLRIGIIYVLSAIFGSFLAALFLVDRPSVSSSGALSGLIGAMLSGLIRNWKCYDKKIAGLIVIFFISAVNLALGLLPYVNNFSNIGGFISGFLLGFILLFTPQTDQTAKSKGGLFEYDIKYSARLKQRLDKPVLRIISLILLALVLAGVVFAFLCGVNMNKYCGWCQYLDCVPSKSWSCNIKPIHCEYMVSGKRLTMTCLSSDKFKVLPFADYSPARLQDLCYVICS